MPIPEPNIYVYKIVADIGGAPCVKNNLLSLAICKPKIRKTAAKGSIVFGFGGKDYEERLIYIAKVTAKLQGDAYYRQRKYARRPDCIYRVRMAAPFGKPLPNIIPIPTRERKMSARASRERMCCLAMIFDISAGKARTIIRDDTQDRKAD